MKTIILVWTYKFNNLVVDNYNNFFGLGDLLRGAISMFQLSKKYNFKLIVDIQLHNISNFLKYDSNEYSNYVLENKNNIPFIYPHNIENFIINNNNELCCLFTNNFLIEEITEECKQFIKNILVPNDDFSKYINDLKISKNITDPYNIIHFRLGDSLLVRKERQRDFKKYIEILNNNRDPNNILISDSEIFKEHIMVSKYDIKLFHIHIAHLGYEQHNNIKDTLFEFFLITTSSNIKTFSVYDHISGFVYMAHFIYDIPLIESKL